uniref:Immunoglobulin I-set domain-containing protein n=1 Tax=Megaselia scalaris TaxID=36166 RepID=T1GS18_MEGSC
MYFMVKVVEGERLILTNVQRTDMGGYRCVASNGVPPAVSKRFDVNVHCKYFCCTIFLALLFYIDYEVFDFFEILLKVLKCVEKCFLKNLL